MRDHVNATIATRRTAITSLLGLALPLHAQAPQEFSEAERALFMAPHLARLRPPTTLHYRYTQSGTLEEGFVDSVALKLAAQSDGRCCAASADFLTGARRLALPEVPAADSNPVLLYFLERDIREMSRRTKGQANYFRKRIRMAIFQGARTHELQIAYRGKNVAARQFTIAPYIDDPLRARFEALAGKQYRFTLSDAVPGTVVSLRGQVDASAAGAEPLLVEELLLDGATLPKS